MANDTLATLVGRVQQRVGTVADYHLVVDWLSEAFRDAMGRIEWSWRRRRGQFLYYAPYSTGLVSIARGESIAVFSGGAAITQAMTGRQLRAGGNDTPISTLTYLDSTHASLDQPWGGAALTSAPFEIYQAYSTVPEDFDSFISIADLARNFQLDFWSRTAADLDRVDPKRAYGGNVAYWMVLRDYTQAGLGPVGPLVQARGTGSSPVSSGGYTGVGAGTFTVEMTSASVFRWRKGTGGAYTSGIAIDAAGNPQELAEGVFVAFPSDQTYTSGDVFVISAAEGYAPGLPRYEPWPHIKADEVRPFLYLSKLPDLSDEGTMLPRYMRGDVLVEMALAACARWPGSESRPNPYYSLKLATLHDARAESKLVDLEREDQARETTDLTYDDWAGLPVYDSAYLAGHDAGYEIDVLDG